jgi:hypothetical protein
MARAQDVISTAYRRLIAEIPSFDRLKLVVRVELHGRGDVQVFRVRIPGPEITKGGPDDARLEVTVARSKFNELAGEGAVKDWREAIESGQVRVGGDPEIQRLIATVVERHEDRGRVRRVH